MSSECEVRIVQLKPMRVACYRAVGRQPELASFKVVQAWAREKGLLNQKDTRFFGFDDPGPSTGKDEYGYEVMITVGPEIKESGEIRIREFPGGLYAVMQTSLAGIGRAWTDIIEWCRASKYVQGQHQCLEEHLTLPLDEAADRVPIDLHLPISE